MALYKIQRSQAWHINAVLKKKILLPSLRCASPLVLPIPGEHSSATHCSSEGGKVSAAHLLQKLLLLLGWVKPGLLSVTIQFLSPFSPKLRNATIGLAPSWGLVWVLPLTCIWILFFGVFFKYESGLTADTESRDLTHGCRNWSFSMNPQAGAKPFAKGIIPSRGKTPITKGHTPPQQIHAIYIASTDSLQRPAICGNLTRRYKHF